MKHRCRSSASFARDRDGAVTIEFVVTLPLFLVALAFAFEFGQIFLAHQSTVNNVRAASRYLSRTAVTPANLACAQDIVRTGRMVLSAGACAAPVPGTYPEYLEATHADVTIDADYATFGPPTFAKAGKTIRIDVRVEYPLSIFSLAGDNRPFIPFRVTEDARVASS